MNFRLLEKSMRDDAELADAVLAGAEEALLGLGPRALAADGHAAGSGGEQRADAALPRWAALLRRFAGVAGSHDDGARRRAAACLCALTLAQGTLTDVFALSAQLRDAALFPACAVAEADALEADALRLCAKLASYGTSGPLSRAMAAAVAAFAVDAKPETWLPLCGALERATARVATADGAAAAAAAASARAGLLAAVCANVCAALGGSMAFGRLRVSGLERCVEVSAGDAGSVTLTATAPGVVRVGAGARTGCHYFELSTPAHGQHTNCVFLIGWAPAAPCATHATSPDPFAVSIKSSDMRWRSNDRYKSHQERAYRPGTTLGLAVNLASGRVACHYDGAWLPADDSLAFSCLANPAAPLLPTVEFMCSNPFSHPMGTYLPVTLRLDAPLPPGAPAHVRPAAAATVGLDVAMAARIHAAVAALLDVLGAAAPGGADAAAVAPLLRALTAAQSATAEGAAALMRAALAEDAAPSAQALRAVVLDTAGASPAAALRFVAPAAGESAAVDALCAIAAADFRAAFLAATPPPSVEGDAAPLAPADSMADAAAPSPAAAPSSEPSSPEDPLASLPASVAASVQQLMELLSATDAWEVYLELRAHNNDVAATANAWLEASTSNAELRGRSYAREHGILLAPPLSGAEAAAAAATAAAAAADAAADALPPAALPPAAALRVLACLQAALYARADDDAAHAHDKDAACALTATVLQLCCTCADVAAAAPAATAARALHACRRARAAWEAVSPTEALLPAAAAFLASRPRADGWARRLREALAAAPPALRGCAALERDAADARRCPLRLAWAAVVALTLEAAADAARQRRIQAVAAPAAAFSAAALSAPQEAPRPRLRTQLSAALAEWFRADELPTIMRRPSQRSADDSNVDLALLSEARARPAGLRSQSTRLAPAATFAAPARTASLGVAALAPLLAADDDADGAALWRVCAPARPPREDGPAPAAEAALARAILAALLHHSCLTTAVGAAAAAARRGGSASAAELPPRVEQCAARAASEAMELIEAHVHTEEGPVAAAGRAASLLADVRERAALLLTLAPAAGSAESEAAAAAAAAAARALHALPPLLRAARSASNGGGDAGGGLRAAQSVPATPLARPIGRSATLNLSGIRGGLAPASSVDSAASDDVGGRRRATFLTRGSNLSRSFLSGAAMKRDDRVMRFLTLTTPAAAVPATLEEDAPVTDAPPAAAAACAVPAAAPAPVTQRSVAAALAAVTALARAADASAAATVVLTAQLLLGAPLLPYSADALTKLDSSEAEATVEQLLSLHDVLQRASPPLAPVSAQRTVSTLHSHPISEQPAALAGACGACSATINGKFWRCATGCNFNACTGCFTWLTTQTAGHGTAMAASAAAGAGSSKQAAAPARAWLLPYLLALRVAAPAPFLTRCAAPAALVASLRDVSAAGAAAAAAQLALHADAAFGGAGDDVSAPFRAALLEALLAGLASARDALLELPALPPADAARRADEASLLLGALARCRPLRAAADTRTVLAALWLLASHAFAAAAPEVAHAAMHALTQLLPELSPAEADAALPAKPAAGDADAAMPDAAADAPEGGATVAALVALAAHAESALAAATAVAAAAAAAPPSPPQPFPAAVASGNKPTFRSKHGKPQGKHGKPHAPAPRQSFSGGSFGSGAPGAFGAPASAFGTGAFGAPAAPSTNVFGAVAPAFGSPPAAAGGLFGAAPAAAAPPVFGVPFAAPAVTARNAFGVAPPPAATPGAPFGFEAPPSAYGFRFTGVGAPCVLLASPPSPGLAVAGSLQQLSFGMFGAPASPGSASGTPLPVALPAAGGGIFGAAANASSLVPSGTSPGAASPSADAGAAASPAAGLAAVSPPPSPLPPPPPPPQRVAGLASLGAAAAAALQRLAASPAWRPAVTAFLDAALAHWRAAPPRAAVALAVLGGAGETLRAGVVCATAAAGRRVLVARPPSFCSTGIIGAPHPGNMLRLDPAGDAASALAPPEDCAEALPEDLPAATGASDEECDAALAAVLPMVSWYLDVLLGSNGDSAQGASPDVASPRVGAAALRALARLCAASPARALPALAASGQLARLLRAAAGAMARLPPRARLEHASRELEETYAACTQAALRGDADAAADAAPNAQAFWVRHNHISFPSTSNPELLKQLLAEPLPAKAAAVSAAPAMQAASIFGAAPTSAAAAASEPAATQHAPDAPASSPPDAARDAAASPGAPLPALRSAAADEQLGFWQAAWVGFSINPATMGGADPAPESHAKCRVATWNAVSALTGVERGRAAGAAARALGALHCMRAAMVLFSAAPPGALGDASGADVLAVIQAGFAAQLGAACVQEALAGALTGLAPAASGALVRDALHELASGALAQPLAGVRMLNAAVAAARAGAPPVWARDALMAPQAAHAVISVVHACTGAPRRRALRLLSQLLRARAALEAQHPLDAALAPAPLPPMAGILAAYDSALAASKTRGETDYGCASLHALADTIMASEELGAVVPVVPDTGATPQLGDWAARARRVQPVESADEAFAGAFRLAPLDAACDTAAACSLLQASAALSAAAPCFEMTVHALDGADMAVGVAAAAPPQQLTAASMPALAESLGRAGDAGFSAARFAVFWAADGQLLLKNVVATHKERTIGTKNTVSTVSTAAAPSAPGGAQPQVRAIRAFVCLALATLMRVQRNRNDCRPTRRTTASASPCARQPATASWSLPFS
jgi:hypothetical protein